MTLSKQLFGFLLLASFIGYGQLETTPTSLNNESIEFIQNNGQWHENVQYRAPLGAGSVFLENNAITYVQLNLEQLSHEHDNSAAEELVDGHVWRSTLLGANPNPQIIGVDERSTYHNYFIGQDPAKWAAHVPIFNVVQYAGIYSGIDMEVYSSNAHFKYDFLVEPFANPAQIQLEYAGLDGMEIRNGNLILITSIGVFMENSPYAYQLINGEKIVVKCQFQIDGNTVSFYFPEGYDESKDLVIDPELIGATLSGSTVFNYGHGATYDNEGNIYTSAASTETGYLTTVGAFQTSYAGGDFDVAISKYSPAASALIYATYIGGANSDHPNSFATNASQELFIYGSTNSLDFPVSADAYQTASTDDGSEYDIFVLHLSADGGSLIGSTYMSGSGEDGQNPMTGEYGTERRGEILVDEFDNCYIATTTASPDFPTTIGSYQETFGGGLLDATVFSLSSDMSDLNWATFIGSTTDEVALSLHFDEAENLLVNGATSGEFMTMSGYQSTYQGGTTDGFIVQLLGDGTAIGNGSYWGTAEKDAVYLIEQDIDGNIYLYGKSDGGSIVTPGVYSNPDSHQFIAQLSNDLATLNFATIVGNGGDGLTPSGFMVDSCGYIYFAGFNIFESEGFYYSPDAITDEGGIYLGVLEPLAVDMQYATGYSGNHLDGSVCHFDAVNKVVYHSVCACDTFLTTDGAHDTTIDGFGICDIGVFKLDFSGSFVTSSIEVLPGIEGEAPFAVDFDCNAAVDDSIYWDFGDGEGSNEEDPAHIFDEVGVYDVWFYVYGICNIDSVLITITVTEDIDDTGINELESSISIYPNPANDQFTINGLKAGTKINLLNAQGKVVYSAISTSKNVNIKTKDLVNGLYFIQFEGEVSEKMQRILVSH
ncbi:MAG: T9SS type A sorting domain-containing protein [Crocinitomix sp.]|nr:T9SS type A sorting domain-containing protein [Crocinitomix sp.]